MCNPKNYSDSPATSRSTVEELHRPIPSLFRALTEGDSPINMMVVSFPVTEELSPHENLVSFLESLDDMHQNVSVPGNSIHTSYDTQGTAGVDLVTLLRFLRNPKASPPSGEPRDSFLCLFQLLKNTALKKKKKQQL